MIYAAGVHDPTSFVIYSGDTPSYVKCVYSMAELDALMAAAIEHLRRNGRDVVLLERDREEEPDA